ncbi:MAG: hypothetical protein ACRDGV_10845 [Candidatus Limnocylindria bacterium]
MSFSRCGERGRIDLVARHPVYRLVLITEIKTDLVDVQALLGAMDVRVRLAPFIARELGVRSPLAVLDQRAVAGIGNVYKSEVCFIERLDPWAAVGAVEDESLHRALTTARRLLRANLRGGARVTTGSRRRGEGRWVYGRAGRPCRRCGSQIAARRQGELARLTYWCPRCQPGSQGRPSPRAQLTVPT